jgi:hypothetical protein
VDELEPKRFGWQADGSYLPSPAEIKAACILIRAERSETVQQKPSRDEINSQRRQRRRNKKMQTIKEK